MCPKHTTQVPTLVELPEGESRHKLVGIKASKDVQRIVLELFDGEETRYANLPVAVVKSFRVRVYGTELLQNLLADFDISWEGDPEKAELPNTETINDWKVLIGEEIVVAVERSKRGYLDIVDLYKE